ncbi:MAG: hypothetical protein ACRDOH_29535 [Streptosporangiaceae bacterium]
MTTTQPTPDPLTGGPGVPALLISGLAKSFGDTAAVSDVELTVWSGSFLAVVRAILAGFFAAGGTAVTALVEQVWDHVAVMATGRILRTGTLSAVRGGQTLEAAFAELVGAAPARGLSWFAS